MLSQGRSCRPGEERDSCQSSNRKDARPSVSIRPRGARRSELHSLPKPPHESVPLFLAYTRLRPRCPYQPESLPVAVHQQPASSTPTELVPSLTVAWQKEAEKLAA